MFLQTNYFLFILSNAYDRVAHIENISLILSFLIIINHLKTESFLHPKTEDPPTEDPPPTPPVREGRKASAQLSSAARLSP